MFTPNQHNQKYCCKECYQKAARVRSRKWASDNKERLKETQKSWRLKNPKKLKEYRKRYESKNKDRIAQNHKNWRKNNPEKYKENYERFNRNRQMYRCSKKYENCLKCPTDDGDCLYD